MTNADQARRWLFLALRCAKWGACIGAGLGVPVGAIIMATGKNTGAEVLVACVAIGGFWGAAAAGAIPAAVMGWLLLLVMLGQAASAVRGDGPRRG